MNLYGISDEYFSSIHIGRSPFMEIKPIPGLPAYTLSRKELIDNNKDHIKKRYGISLEPEPKKKKYRKM